MTRKENRIYVTKISGDTSDGYHTFNELYSHRHYLFSLLLRQNKDIAWKSLKHGDGSSYPNFFVAGIEFPQGVICYHLPLKLFDRLDYIKTLEQAPKWDGSSADDILDRLKLMVIAKEKE